MNSCIGQSIIRVDAKDKVTGKVKYPSDIYIPDMLHIELVRSTVPHAYIKKIEVTGIPPSGAIIITSKDIPNNAAGSIIKDQPILADEKVRFYGEPIAIVAAPTREVAQALKDMIIVDYDYLPTVETAKEALKKNTAFIHRDGNLVTEMKIKNGDPEAAFARADLILEDSFYLPVVDHLCLETEGGVAYWEDNILKLEVGTQNPFHDRREIAYMLNLSEDKIDVRCPQTGGGFGGKDGNTVQLFLALTAWKTGKPCRLVFSREESLLSTFKRHSAEIWMKIGFLKNGNISGFQTELYYDTGAYAALGPAVLGVGVEHSSGPYRVADAKIEGYLCYTDKAPASAMRGFGAPQTAFAVETLLDRAAYRLGLDPLDIRLANVVVKGDRGVLGHTLKHSVGIKDALIQISKMPLWQENLINKNPLVGYGLAIGYLGSGMGKGIPDEAVVNIEINEDGTYHIKVGVVDIGQGNATAFAQIAASDLEVPIEAIKVTMADTCSCNDCGSTAGSRTTYIGGLALRNAIEDLKNNISSKGIKKGKGRAIFPEVDDFHSHLGPGLPHAIYGFIAQVAKIALDKNTGTITLESVDAVTEAGTIINPMNLEGQIQGGIAMAAGYALMEEMIYESGIPKTCNLTTYLLPTSLDLPDVNSETVLIEEESGPFGAKGCAELGTLALAPAIANAIFSITGYSANTLPLKMETIYKTSKTIK